MNRREFVGISIGVLGTLTGAPGRRRRPPAPDPEYLALGLTAMARADSWFDAHWGAGVIAGTYLIAENELDPGVADAIRGQLDVAIELSPEVFRPFPSAPVRAGASAAIARALEPALEGGLRDSGHAVVYTSLVLRALEDVPEMARPSVVDGILEQTRRIARSRPKPPTNVEPYADTDAMVAATFDSVLRFEGLVGRPHIKRPNFTHMMTHTEALKRLDELGYGELARRGHGGLRVHIDEPVPAVKDEEVLERDQVRLSGILAREFWEDAERQAYWREPWNRRRNPNGDWIASGHLFKVLYAFCALARRIADEAVVERCATVLLERYFDPDVLGG